MAQGIEPTLPSSEARIRSFEAKPANGGTPARERAPTAKVLAVMGIRRASPPIDPRWLEWTAWITLPAARKRRALKKAWVPRWKNPAKAEPAPRAATMNP